MKKLKVSANNMSNGNLGVLSTSSIPKIDSINRILVYLLIVGAVLGTAVLYLPAGAFRITLFRIVLPLLWFLFLLKILFNHGKLNISHIKVKPYLLFLVIWLAYSAFTLGWAASKSDVLKYAYFLFTGFSIIFFITFYLYSLKNLKRFYVLWILIMMILVSMGLWECYIGENFIPTQHSKAGAFFPTSIFAQTNTLATFLVFSFPFVLACLHYKKGIFKQIFGFFLLLAGFYLLIMTGSRINILAFLIEIFIFFLFILRSPKEKVKFIAPLCLTIILLFIFGSNLIYTNAIKAINEQIEITGNFNEITKYSPDSSFFMRKKLLEGSVIYFINSFGFGVGAGNIDQYLGALESQKIYAGEEGKRNPHNWWAEILANFGIFIFLGYLIFYFSLIYNLWRIHHHFLLRSEKIICEGLILSLICFSIASLSSSSIVSFGPHWLLFAFALAFINYYRSRPKSLS